MRDRVPAIRNRGEQIVIISEYTTWDGNPLKVTYTPASIAPKSHKGDKGVSEANVKRTFKPSGGLYKAIFCQENGVFNDKTAATMSLRQRTTWLHLWDGVCCRSISPAEAWDCITAGYVLEELTVRASNYMHLL